MYSGSDKVVSNLTVAILSPLFQFQTIICHSGMPDKVKIASLFENSTLKYSVAAPSKIWKNYFIFFNFFSPKIIHLKVHLFLY